MVLKADFGRVMIEGVNGPHQNRLCFLCYFLCTSKESRLNIRITLINYPVVFYDVHPQLRIVTQDKFQPELASLR